MRKLDYTGRRFGRLLVTGDTGERRHGKAVWRCRCDCGAEHLAVTDTLRQGHTKSCGCLQRELLSARCMKHGHTTRAIEASSPMRCTREYSSWLAAKARCFNPGNKCFAIYGGRGITLCQRWRESFEYFFADMGPCPPGHSIERINSDGNYEPANCRWAAALEQGRNTKRVIAVQMPDGSTKPVGAIADMRGIKRSTLYAAVARGHNPLTWVPEKRFAHR